MAPPAVPAGGARGLVEILFVQHDLSRRLDDDARLVGEVDDLFLRPDRASPWECRARVPAGLAETMKMTGARTVSIMGVICISTAEARRCFLRLIGVERVGSLGQEG